MSIQTWAMASKWGRVEETLPVWQITVATTHQQGRGASPRWQSSLVDWLVRAPGIKVKGVKRRDRRAQRRNGTGLTTSDESEPDSAFPARTPEQQNIKVKNSAVRQHTCCHHYHQFSRLWMTFWRRRCLSQETVAEVLSTLAILAGHF